MGQWGGGTVGQWDSGTVKQWDSGTVGRQQPSRNKPPRRIEVIVARLPSNVKPMLNTFNTRQTSVGKSSGSLMEGHDASCPPANRYHGRNNEPMIN